MDRSRSLLIVGATVATAAIFVAWLVSDRGTPSGGREVSGDPPTAAEPVPLAEGSTTDPDEAWVQKVAEDNLIPLRAMQAYARTEISQREAFPECKLRWNTLAGIGSVESAHGTLGGAGLDEQGVPSKPIIGPALDGTNGTRAIEATEESTALHGDEKWDRAVGPFQFLGSSWTTYGGDADADGEANPNDIDDAALGAARHLCVDQADLSGDDWVRSVFGYNNSMAYVDKVRSIASSFAG